MGARICLIVSGLLALSAVFPLQAATLAEGRAAPGFEIKSLDGREIDLPSARGKVVLLHFWATWCPPCREELPALEAFYREHRQDGFEVVAVSVDDPADAAKVRDFAHRLSYPVATQASADIRDYGRIWRLPLSFLIDRNGILRKSDWSGEQKIDAASLEKFVAPLLEEK